MNSRQRLLTALKGEIPDRLPVTTHHLMPGFLRNCCGGLSEEQFFERFGLDAVRWLRAATPGKTQNASFDRTETASFSEESPHLLSPVWRIEREEKNHTRFTTIHYRIRTPKKTLLMKVRKDPDTTWLLEPLIKEKTDIEIFAEYAPVPLCDIQEVNRNAAEFGNRGIIRGAIPGFDIFGQPGCWQDAAALYGIEPLIMATFSDPEWVHTFLQILCGRKLKYAESTNGAAFDLIELGGGDASTTVISPQIFETFVAPYDSRIIQACRESGQRIVYHTCGGMMPILEMLADMGPEALETFTPPGIGGDADLKKAKKIIGGRVCMIGGFDQFHFFTGCTPEDTRREVRRCFDDAGPRGGYICSPSDHFFKAEPELLEAFGKEAVDCIY